MGVVVQFDYASWIARYPEFASVPQATAQLYFNEATTYHRNDGGGPINNAAKQSILLNMMTAHVAALADTQRQSAVGRINSATEGSVTAQMDFVDPSTDRRAWLQQTQYGAAYLAATTGITTMNYRAPPPRLFGGRGVY